MLELKSVMSSEIQRETGDLKDEILAVKKHFDEQKDHVTQFDSTVVYLKKQAKKQKKDLEESHLELKTELEGYRLDILRAERAYDSFNGQIGQVYDQMMDIEQRLIQHAKGTHDADCQHHSRFEELERYLKVVQPMNTFAAIASALHNSLADKMLAQFVEFEHNQWPQLQENLEGFDSWKEPEPSVHSNAHEDNGEYPKEKGGKAGETITVAVENTEKSAKLSGDARS